MNSGIQDADNLAWKLASIHNGQAGEELLESYHIERHAAARENLRVTEATIRFMVPPNRLRRWTRSALLRLSHSLGLARSTSTADAWPNPLSTPSRPSCSRPTTPCWGRSRRTCGSSTSRRDCGGLLGHRFVALCFATTGARAAELLQQARSGSCDMVVVLPVGAPAEGVPAGARVIRSDDTESLARYGTVGGTWWVVRPDGHLAARGSKGEDFAAALMTAAGVVTSDRILVKGTHA